MSKETESAILKALDGEFDIESELHQHFEEFGRWSSAEISEEAIRVATELLDIDVEETSPLESLIHMSVAAGQTSGFAVVAAALGLELDILAMALAEWEEHQDKAPKAVSFNELLEKMKKEREWHASMVEEVALAKVFITKVTKLDPKQ